MNKKNLLKVVNVILCLLFINQALTGILYSFLPKDLFEFLHMGGFLLILSAILHVYLNWAWVKANLLPGLKKTGE
jgi:hypothetical protein